LPASSRSVGQPTPVSAARARSGARSATPTSAMPGVRNAWARYMVPNLPAPISPTRSGRPADSRSSSSLCRFIGDASFSRSPCERQVRDLHRRIQQAVVPERLDRGEIAMRYVVRPLEATDVIGDGAQAQVHDG